MAPDLAADVQSLQNVNIKCGIVAGLVAMADRLGVPCDSWFEGLRLHRNAGTAADSVPALARAPTSWSPSDPRLSGAAIELDAARLELQQAMQQSPHSPSLQRLLARTEQQQTQLRRLVHEAG